MKRIAIYNYFNEKKIVTSDVELLLKELNKNVDSLIIVINGQVNNEEIFFKYTSDIITRPNKGMDAGAYKHVICSENYHDYICEHDELILCNNSFIGPFKPLKNIFERMENNSCDFWGLSGSFLNFARQIQSYFMVYKKQILKSQVFWDYFERNINEYENDYESICAAFENGLFRELVHARFVPDAYVSPISYDLYSNPLGSISVDKVPIIKKKAFVTGEENGVWESVKYIEDNYDYPIAIIKETVNELYGITPSKRIKHKENKTDFYIDSNSKTIEDLDLFLETVNKVWIYGTGNFAKHVFMTAFSYSDHPKLNGFLETSPSKASFLGYDVKSYSKEIIDEMDGVIVAVSREKTQEILEIIGASKKVFVLWK